MKELFQVGYDMAVKGYPWEKAPPGFHGVEVVPTQSQRQPDAVAHRIPQSEPTS